MKKLLFTAVLLFSICTSYLSAQTENLNTFQLENGLKVYIQENHSIPLAYMEVAVRCGSITQEENQNGIFNLYGQMLLKGNSRYKSSRDVSKALADLGVSDCTGTANKEFTSFSFTIPSDKISQGIDFWAAALRNPKFDKRELENQKKVMISQISMNKQQKALESFIDSKLFPDCTWKTDCYGTKESMEKITVKQLKEIQKDYYVPNNTAIFIGGDVNLEEVKKLILKYFGNWKRSKTNWTQNFKLLSQNPLPKTEYYVYPTSEISDQSATVYISFRGPDGQKNSAETIIQNLLLSIFENPDGCFKKNYMENQNLGITDSNTITITSDLAGFTSVITLKADFLVPEQYLPERVQLFREELPVNISEFFAQKENTIEREIEKAKKREEYKLLFQTQSPKELLSILRNGWIATDSDYFTSYLQKIQSIEQINLETFCKEYISDVNPLVIVSINPEVYKYTKQRFIDEGFTELSFQF